MWFEGYTIWERSWQIYLKTLFNAVMSNHITLEKVVSTYSTVDTKNQQTKQTARDENEASKLYYSFGFLNLPSAESVW